MCHSPVPLVLMSWQAALRARLLYQQACSSHTCQLFEEACCAKVPPWCLHIAKALMFAQLQAALLSGCCQPYL